jgi:hypothetical protein
VIDKNNSIVKVFNFYFFSFSLLYNIMSLGIQNLSNLAFDTVVEILKNSVGGTTDHKTCGIAKLNGQNYRVRAETKKQEGIKGLFGATETEVQMIPITEIESRRSSHLVFNESRVKYKLKYNQEEGVKAFEGNSDAFTTETAKKEAAIKDNEEAM